MIKKYLGFDKYLFCSLGNWFDVCIFIICREDKLKFKVIIFNVFLIILIIFFKRCIIYY